MKKGSKSIDLDFEIDELTNSIKNTISGEIFNTDVLRITKGDVKHLKKTNWQFDWQKEIKKIDRQTFKLVTITNPEIIHGLTSITDNRDHIFMHLIENAKFNKGTKNCIPALLAILLLTVVKPLLKKAMMVF